MKIYLIPHNDEYSDQEGDISTCVLHNGKINILFNVIDDGSPVQGKLSIEPTEKYQKLTGLWIYPVTRKESSKFTDRQNESEEYIVESAIEGKLEDYDGKQVIFSGTWTDEDGSYDLDIEAEIT